MTNNKDEILLNIMYSGDYLACDNIGHEVINMFQADNDKYYIYILPYGTMARKHTDIKTVLLVRRHNSKKLEILAKAVVKTIPHTKKKQNQQDNKEQLDYINNNKITYGGVKLDKIFENNTGNGNFITFEADKIIRVSKPIYIMPADKADKANKQTSDENSIHHLDGIEHFAKQSQKMYISSSTHEEAYNQLNEIINAKDNWQEPVTRVSTQQTQSRERCFIDIIKKNYDELVYSNLLQYIFESSSDGFKEFAKQILKIEDWNMKYTVAREENHIDLLIKDGMHTVIIENKIKSGINGICDKQGQKEKVSQLNRYWEAHPNEKNLYGFVFLPDYNHIDLKCFKYGDKYKKILYSDLYHFFEEHKKIYKNVKYFDEFLYALKRHTATIDNSYEEEMFEKFANKLKCLQT